MNTRKRKRLEAAGWRFGQVRDFLGLSLRDELYIEVKLAVANALRDPRTKPELERSESRRKRSSSPRGPR